MSAFLGCDQEVATLPIVNTCPSGAEYVLLIGVQSLISPQNAGGYGLITWDNLVACLSGGASAITAGIVQVVIGFPDQANPVGQATPNVGDFTITLPYRVLPKSETIFYNGGEVRLNPSEDFNYTPVYNLSTTTYVFSQAFDEGFGLDFNFLIVNSTPIPATIGLQAIYVTAVATGNILTVPVLGTFISAQVRGAPYDNNPIYGIPQNGQNLDFSNVGGTIAGETYLIFYYPELV